MNNENGPRPQSLLALDNGLLVLSKAGCRITLTPSSGQVDEHPYRVNLEGPHLNMTAGCPRFYDSLEILYHQYLQSCGLKALQREIDEKEMQSHNKFEAALEKANHRHGGALKKLGEIEREENIDSSNNSSESSMPGTSGP